jgi:hypothetical protein
VSSRAAQINRWKFLQGFLVHNTSLNSEEMKKMNFIPVLRIRIRDPVPFWLLDPGSGMGRKSASGSGIRDEQPGSYFLELRNHFFWVKILILWCGSRIRVGDSSDPGWKHCFIPTRTYRIFVLLCFISVW